MGRVEWWQLVDKKKWQMESYRGTSWWRFLKTSKLWAASSYRTSKKIPTVT
jgi:hypothetical protein